MKWRKCPNCHVKLSLFFFYIALYTLDLGRARFFFSSGQRKLCRTQAQLDTWWSIKLGHLLCMSQANQILQTSLSPLWLRFLE
mmetsp:Transcript_19072/g.35305  ORF Transcript_19072/g.35305 Transcript_19072/m.35305 type:complete len:83 (+) Transcript_19072:3-251(+)